VRECRRRRTQHTYTHIYIQTYVYIYTADRLRLNWIGEADAMATTDGGEGMGQLDSFDVMKISACDDDGMGYDYEFVLWFVSNLPRREQVKKE